MAYAKAADVQAIYGKSLTTEKRRLSILRRIPDLADQIAAEKIDSADVVDIEAEAVLRVIRNPRVYTASRTAPTATNCRVRLPTIASASPPRSGNDSGSSPKMFSIAPRLGALL